MKTLELTPEERVKWESIVRMVEPSLDRRMLSPRPLLDRIERGEKFSTAAGLTWDFSVYEYVRATMESR